MKAGGREAPRSAGAYLLRQEGPAPLLISEHASAHGALHAGLKGSKENFDPRVGLLFMKYGCFIFHLLLLGWFTNLVYNSREMRINKTKSFFMHYFLLLAKTIMLLLAETNDSIDAEGLGKGTRRSSAFRLLTLLKVPFKSGSREATTTSACNKAEMIFHE